MDPTWMIMDNNKALILLNRLPRIGPKRIKALIDRWPNPAEVFELSRAALEKSRLAPKVVDAILDAPRYLGAVEKDMAWSKESKHHIVTYLDSEYPELLKEISDAPPVLYASGKLDCLNQPALAVVGTRSPSVGAFELTIQWASSLAKEGLVIVSGLARGIDGQAHLGALKATGKTIAVLGAGIDCIYPKQHARLAEEVQDSGLLLSEFPLGVAPFAGHFPRRNRIISGLSLATLVIEAALKSGSLTTAHLALDQNRGVMAVPGSVYNPQAKGCHALLQQGAALVTSTQEVLEELCLDKRYGGSFKELDSQMGGTGSLTVYIGFDVTTIDEIVVKSSLPVEDVITDLAELELQGQVKAVPGGYIRCML